MARRKVSKKNKKMQQDLDKFANGVKAAVMNKKREIAKETAFHLLGLSPVWAGDYVESFRVGFGVSYSLRFELTPWKLTTPWGRWPFPMTFEEAAALKVAVYGKLKEIIEGRIFNPKSKKGWKQRDQKFSEDINISNAIFYADHVEYYYRYYVFNDTVAHMARRIPVILKTKGYEFKGVKPKTNVNLERNTFEERLEFGERTFRKELMHERIESGETRSVFDKMINP